jgi:AraC-like DNA-binding protein
MRLLLTNSANALSKNKITVQIVDSAFPKLQPKKQADHDAAVVAQAAPDQATPAVPRRRWYDAAAVQVAAGQTVIASSSHDEVFVVQAHRADVASFSLHSNDLVVEFADARKLVIRGFFDGSAGDELIENSAPSAGYISRALVVEAASKHPLPQQRTTSRDKILTSRQIRRVTDYIRQHLTSDIQLGELAGVVGLGRTMFIQCFKASLKETPHQYVIRVRVHRAKELLSKFNLSLTEIAMSCGFFDQSHFSRSFKKTTGMTPSAYRRQVR